MSIKSMELVWERSRSKGTARLVLLAIADHDGDGGAWPAIRTLARKANCSERSVQKHIATLVELGELEVHYNAGGTHMTASHSRPNRYEIALKNAVDNTDHPQLHPVKDDVVGGEGFDTPPVSPVTPEPPMNHPEPAAGGGGTATAVEKPDTEVVRRRLKSLAIAFADDVRLAPISFSIPAAKAATIADLIDRHGIPQLVDAARRTTDRDRSPRRVDAYISTWSQLRGRLLRPDEQPLCRICSKPESACRTANKKLAPDDRCEGTETS